MQAAQLAAAEGVDVFLLVGYGEKEMTQELAGADAGAVGHLDIVGNFGDGVYDFLVAVEGNAVLAVVSEAHGLAHVEVARVGRHNALQHLDKRGLAYAVGTHDAHFVVAGKDVVEVVEDDFVAVSFADVVGDKDF